MDKLCKDLGKMNIVDWKKSVPQKKKTEWERSEDFITLLPTQNSKKVALGLIISVCAGRLLGKREKGQTQCGRMALEASSAPSRPEVSSFPP